MTDPDDITPEEMAEFEEWLENHYDARKLVFRRRQAMKRLLAALRRRDEQIATLRKVIDYGELFKGPRLCCYSDCDAVADTCNKHDRDARAERDAANAKLARAVELLRESTLEENWQPADHHERLTKLLRDIDGGNQNGKT